MDGGSTTSKYNSEIIVVERNGIQYNCYCRHTLPIDTKKRGVIVLLHGILSSSATMMGLMEYLSSKGYECFAPDLLGHGFTTVSNINPSDYKVDFVAEIIHDLVIYMGL